MAGKLELSGKLVPSPRNRINSNREISEASMAEFQDLTCFQLKQALVFHTWNHYDKLFIHIERLR